MRRSLQDAIAAKRRQLAEPSSPPMRCNSLTSFPQISCPSTPSPGGSGIIATASSSGPVGRGFVGAAVAGPGHEGLGLEGSETALGHEPADAVGGTNDALIVEFLPDLAVAERRR